jgi:CRISPR system Cascade subunit CasC
MLIELHILQNLPPSCLNRDDTNTPKDCEFGGHRRARLSSQRLKRAVRWHPAFAEALQVPLAARTKRVAEALTVGLVEAGYPEALAGPAVCAVVQEAVGQVGSDGRTRVLMYLGQDELERLSQAIRANWDDLAQAAATPTREPAAVEAGPRGRVQARAGKEPLLKAARRVAATFTPGSLAPDIALFGRMIAENTHFNVEAACQVAHAISTHRVTMEMDFFTAVDDLKPGRRGTAEMIGTSEFYSACFYRYSVVSLTQLAANLSGDQEAAADVTEAFVRASVAALPRGRQGSSAAHSPPSFVMAVVRASGSPWSLVNAFEAPVWASDRDRHGIVARSMAALDAYWGDLITMYGSEGIVATAACWLGRATAPRVQACRVDDLERLMGVVRASIHPCAVVP